MNKLKRVILILVFMLVSIILVGLISFYINTSAVSKSNKEVKITVSKNSTYYLLSKNLYDNNLIKSEFWYKVYIKIMEPKNLETGEYVLNKNMSVKQIIDILEKGSNSADTVNITFKEGYNIRDIAKAISSKTNNSYDDVLNTVTDKDYINELINKYWFLTEDILNSQIYFPLEGYLFPETYNVIKTSSVKEILDIMLKQTDVILSEYKTDIESSSYNIHSILTLASIIEKEASKSNDRYGVSGVFYNRLSSKWTLGSDVTTYYGSKIDDFSYSLTSKELNDCSNGYNTRCSTKIGLPVGPINNPSKQSILAAIKPTNHNYFYFVADCSGKTYLNYTSKDHYNTINMLKEQDNWCA